MVFPANSFLALAAVIFAFEKTPLPRFQRVNLQLIGSFQLLHPKAFLLSMIFPPQNGHFPIILLI